MSNAFADLIPEQPTENNGGLFDDLVPSQPETPKASSANMFADLVPQQQAEPLSPFDNRYRELLAEEELYQAAMADYKQQLGQTNAAGFGGDWTRAKAPDSPARELDAIRKDWAMGLNYLRDNEFSQVIHELEQGNLSGWRGRAVVEELSNGLSPEAVRMLEVSRLTGEELNQLRNISNQLTTDETRKQDVFRRGVYDALTLGYANAPDEDKLSSDDLNVAAAERARQLIENEEAANLPLQNLLGQGVGSIMPFGAGVAGLRALRTARGLAPVGVGAKGAVIEGAKVGGVLGAARRPEGAEDMSTSENIAARIQNASLEVALGAVFDAGIVKMGDWVKAVPRLVENAQIRRQAKQAGFDSTEEYLNNLVRYEQTPDGDIVSLNKEIADELPDPNASTTQSPDDATASYPGAEDLWSGSGETGPGELAPEAAAVDTGDSAAGLNLEPDSRIATATAPTAGTAPYRRVTTIRGTGVDVDYAVVDADDLITSHGPNGVTNTEYPVSLQPRDRSRGSSEAQVRQMAANLRPEWMGASPKASDGAPIIGPDRVVESGNGRVAAIRYSYDGGDTAGYRQWLSDNAEAYGLDKDVVSGMDKPVLVRVRTTPLDDANRAFFAREANQSDLARMSPTEQARADGDLLTDDDILMYAPDENGSISNPENLPFLRRFVARLGTLDGGSLVDAQGRPNADAVKRVQSAVFTKAYDDDRLLSMFAEEADPELRNLINSLNSAAPAFARARSFDPELGGDSNIVPNLMDAVDIVRTSRRERQAVSELLNQQSMLGDTDDITAQLARYLDQNLRSPRRMGEALKELAVQLETEVSKGGDDLFGSAPATRQDFIRATDRTLKGRYGDEAQTIEGTGNHAETPRPAESETVPADDGAGGGQGQPHGSGRAAADLAESGTGLPTRQQVDEPDNSSTQGTFYANPLPAAVRTIAREWGRDNAIASVGGGVYGGVSSEHEPGTAQWWLDVAAGAATGGLVSYALRAGKVVGRDSILDRTVSRLGNAIEHLPFIGRGGKEVREIKARQQLMRQLLDRQTEKAGEFLHKRFSPSERAEMADLIEERCIIRDFNLIHRQAAELDDFITHAAEQMKKLGMLPPELETGGYLHRYYAKHLKLDKNFIKAKGQSMAGTYTMARGTDDSFSVEYLSDSTRENLKRHHELVRDVEALEAKKEGLFTEQAERELASFREELRILEQQHYREYTGLQNGKLKSFIMADDEVPKIAGVEQLEQTDRTWTIKGMVQGKALLHRDWTKAERRAWGEIEDAGYRFVRGMAEVSHDLSLATMFRSVANNRDWVSDVVKVVDGKEWIQVPNTTIGNKSPLKKYGALAGQYVRPDIWNAIRHHGRSPLGNGRVATVYRGLLNRWKLYKTVYNPVTHFNNTWSNTEMYYMAGYSPKHLGKSVRLIFGRNSETDPVYREALDAGLFGSDWSASIIKSEGGSSSVLEDLAEKLRTQPEIPDGEVIDTLDTVMRVKEWWINSKNAVREADTRLGSGVAVAKALVEPPSRLIHKPIKAAAQTAQALYRKEDELFKMAVYMAERQVGKSPREAVNAANQFFFDYNDLPTAVKWVRDFPIGSPFISYTYLAIPAIVRNAVERPERLLALAAAYEAVNYTGLLMNGEMAAGEYWERAASEQEVSPKWERGRALWGALNTFHLPSLEGYRLSMANAHALGNPFAGEAGDRKLSLPEQLAPFASFWGSDALGSNPLRALVDVALLNEDWKGKEIYAKNASTETKISRSINYLYQAWSPSNPVMPGSYHQQKIIDGLANDVAESRQVGDKPNSLAEGMVSAANSVSDVLGGQQFTGLDGMKHPIVTRDAALASVGVKLRPFRPEDSFRFKAMELGDRMQELHKEMNRLGYLKSKKRITPNQFDQKRDHYRAEMKKVQEEMKALREAFQEVRP